MFTLATSQTYLTPVKVDMYDESGKLKTHVFKARFRRVDQKELDDINDRLMNKTLSDNELLKQVTVGFEDVLDEKGNRIEFSDEAFDQLLNIFPVRPTMVTTFFNTIGNAIRKN